MHHNGGMDEFSFLPAQAAELRAAGTPAEVPPVRRLTHALPDGRTVSALAYGDAPPVVTFLHGAGLNAHTWDTTVLALGLPALALDLPEPPASRPAASAPRRLRRPWPGASSSSTPPPGANCAGG